MIWKDSFLFINDFWNLNIHLETHGTNRMYMKRHNWPTLHSQSDVRTPPTARSFASPYGLFPPTTSLGLWQEAIASESTGALQLLAYWPITVSPAFTVGKEKSCFEMVYESDRPLQNICFSLDRFSQLLWDHSDSAG